VDDEVNDPAGAGALSDLIEVEARIAAELAAAEAEAEQIVEAAREEVRAVGEASDGTLEAEARKLRTKLDRACEIAIARLEDEARAEEARYRGVDDATQLALARWIASRIVDAEAPS
jgi:hypothetical protein